MNSDNTAAGGVTVDYGPFGFLDRLDSRWNPFTSDADGKFAFLLQPRAAAVNLAVLAKAFAALVRHQLPPPDPGTPPPPAETGGREGGADALVRRLEAAASEGFARAFSAAHEANCGRKLGLLDRVRAAGLWSELVACAEDSEVRRPPHALS
jgi:uncharacterized protein YdiU (UPF0061 family)